MNFIHCYRIYNIINVYNTYIYVYENVVFKYTREYVDLKVFITVYIIFVFVFIEKLIFIVNLKLLHFNIKVIFF